MTAIQPLDASTTALDIWPDLTVTTRRREPGPPKRIAGMTMGLITILPGQSPHDGEMHPDGDEILCVVSGTLSLSYDSIDKPVHIAAGQMCVVPKGEWHLVDCLEETTFVHVTPGPNGEARFA